MPPPRPLDLLPRLHQTAVTRLDERAHRVLHRHEARIAPFRRGVEQHGQRRVALSRLLPDAEAVLGLLDGGGGGVDFPLGVGGAGDCLDGEGFGFVGGPGELACWFLHVVLTRCATDKVTGGLGEGGGYTEDAEEFRQWR